MKTNFTTPAESSRPQGLPGVHSAGVVFYGAKMNFNTNINHLDTGVYVIRHDASGKVYVGSSARCLIKRLGEHNVSLRNGNHHSILLQRAWRKYGSESFTFEVLALCPPDSCIALEQVAIDAYQSSNPAFGFNVAPRAGSVLGIKHSAEARANMSKAHIGKRPSAETLAKNRGRKPSAATRAKMSASHTGKKRSAEFCARMSMMQTGERHSAQTRAKLSAIQKGRKYSPEHCAKLSAIHKGKKHSLASIEKMRVVQSGKIITPETRAKISAAHLGRKLPEATRAKMSESQIARYEKSRRLGVVIKRTPQARAKMAAAWVIRRSRQKQMEDARAICRALTDSNDKKEKANAG